MHSIGLNKPEFSYTNQDIEHSQPDCVKFKTIRSSNPLNPSYNLAQVELRPITPPKYIRDNINNDDIEGSKPKKAKHFETRHNILEVGDIEGSKPRNRTYHRTSQFDAINYRDVTHADFKTKRSTSPLNPSYVVRNDQGNIEEIGAIEGNKPLGIPERKRGPVSTSLITNDIEGAQTSTKGLGVFAHHQRKDYTNTNKIDDIAGSTVGSLKKGPTTNRISNPLNPDYYIPGHTEYNENSGFGKTGQQVVQNTAKSNMNAKNKVPRPPIKFQNNINRDGFKRDIGQFYGHEDRNFADIDFNKLYKATKDPNSGNTAPQIPPEVSNDPSWRRDMKQFYGQEPSETSELNYEQKKFYGDTMGNRNMDPTKFTNVAKGPQPQPKFEPPVNSQHYKRAQAQFYGQSYVPSDKSSDRGSIFQDNAAEFYGLEKPVHGQKPFHISTRNLEDPKKNQPKNTSVLNEMKLKEHERNMQRDPKFGKNLRKFWGMKSQATNSQFGSSAKSYAQKLDGFIS